MSYSQPSVSGVALQEKAFEFDRLRLHDTVHNIMILTLFNDYIGCTLQVTLK